VNTAEGGPNGWMEGNGNGGAMSGQDGMGWVGWIWVQKTGCAKRL